MNVYTSDGLLVSRTAEDGSEDTGLTAEQGQQLISVYRLFLRLHHAGTSVMRLKDMIRPDPNSGGGSGGNDGSGGTATYANSVALLSPDTPYQMFLLSSNALPETHRLRGFPTAAPSAAQVAATPKNNNRCANGCEEIPLRWGLLSKQAPPPNSPLSPGHNANTPAVATPAAGGAAGNGLAMPAAAAAAALAGSRDGADSPAGVSTSSTASGVLPPQPMQPVAAPPSGPHAYPSGWMPAELQVHTTKQVMSCTAAEVSLDVDGGAEDGHAPLLFLCSTQPNAA